MTPDGASFGAPFSAGGGAGPPPPRRSRRLVAGLLSLGMLLVAGLIALGVWQLYRLQWKQALIARVDARVHASPGPAPGPADWPRLTVASAEYRRIRLVGHYLTGRDTFVRAATEAGPGYWVMSPFADRGGFFVLVNRGFVPDRRPVLTPDRTKVVGLLRLSQPGGGFLRRNRPAADMWYSRDVAAIVARRGIAHAAPYFIDAERDPADKTGPIGGLTVIQFANNHLVYALTWFALAAMVAWLTIKLILSERRR